jgi:lipid-binding SYLF domain-containing protein
MKHTLTAIVLTLGVLLSGQVSAAFTAADASEAILVCPKITKGGFIIGVEGGKYAMRVGGKTVGYYTKRAGKFGFLAGVQWYSLILVFNDQAALDKFRTGERWSRSHGSWLRWPS